MVKSIGPEDGATALEIDENGPNTPNNTERAKKLKLLQQSKTKKKERKPGRDKGMKIKDGVSEPQEPMAEGSSQAPEHGPDAADAQGSPKPDAEETLKEKEQIVTSKSFFFVSFLIFLFSRKVVRRCILVPKKGVIISWFPLNDGERVTSAG